MIFTAIVATMVLALGNPAVSAPADDPTIQRSGCSVRACLEAWTSGSGVNVRGKYAPLGNDPNDLYGHFRFWGPHYAFNEPDHWIRGWENGDTHWVNTHGTHCMELWERLSDGSYRSHGLPCVSE